LSGFALFDGLGQPFPGQIHLTTDVRVQFSIGFLVFLIIGAHVLEQSDNFRDPVLLSLELLYDLNGQNLKSTHHLVFFFLFSFLLFLFTALSAFNSKLTIARYE